MILVQSKQQFNAGIEVIEYLESQQTLAVDVETYSTEDTRPLGLAIAWSPQDAIFFSTDEIHKAPRILSLLERPILYHNALFDLEALVKHFRITPLCKDDTMLMAMAAGYPAALRDLGLKFAFDYIPVMSLITDPATNKVRNIRDPLLPKLKSGGDRVRQMNLGDADIGRIGNICLDHARGTYKVWKVLQASTSASYTIDMCLLDTIRTMHHRGFRIDTAKALGRYQGMNTRITEMQERGLKEFNINIGSTVQLAGALAERFLFTAFNKKTGNMITDKEHLLLHKGHPLVDLVLEFRALEKLCSTFVFPLSQVDRVYPRYRIVRTGRFSSSPNVQNIPEEQRDLYLPDEGDFLWSADAHQIEPRISAVLSGDPQMLQDCLTGDIYQPIADRYYISRYVAKQLLLAASYLAGAEQLVTTAQKKGEVLSQADAESLYAALRRDYPRFFQWNVENQNFLQENGYVQTILGRKRTIDSMLEGEDDGYPAEKKATNTIVQGSAADILKLGVLRLQKEKIAATVHDDIICSVRQCPPSDILDNLTEVPVVWKIKTGNNWGSLQ
tara:strand:+ start:6112 stop:7782 length:1671 start_codon:yes stop_codon:yes gene_type:complete